MFINKILCKLFVFHDTDAPSREYNFTIELPAVPRENENIAVNKKMYQVRSVTYHVETKMVLLDVVYRGRS